MPEHRRGGHVSKQHRIALQQVQPATCNLSLSTLTVVMQETMRASGRVLHARALVIALTLRTLQGFSRCCLKPVILSLAKWLSQNWQRHLSLSLLSSCTKSHVQTLFLIPLLFLRACKVGRPPASRFCALRVSENLLGAVAERQSRLGLVKP